MPPDIMAGSVIPAGGAPLGGVAAGPPGSDTGLAALFAALLARSGSPPAGQTQIASAPKEQGALTRKSVSSPKDERLAQKDENPAQPNGSLTGTTTFTQWPPPALPIPMNPTALPNAGAPAGTQNAMDTAPMSASPNVKSVENESGSELPLPEAGTSRSRPLPAFPGFLVSASDPGFLVSASAASAPVSAFGDAAAPLTAAPASGSLTALPAAMPPATVPAASGADSGASEAKVAPAASRLPSFAGFDPPFQSSAASVSEAIQAASVPAASAAPAAEPVYALPSSVPPSEASQGAVSGDAGIPFVAASSSGTSPQPPGEGIASSGAVLPTTISQPALSPAPAVTADSSAAQSVPAVISDSASAAAPTVTAAPSALPAGPVAVTVTPEETPFKTEALKTEALKTEALPADNNTGAQPAPGKKTTMPTELARQVIGKRAERRAEAATSETAGETGKTAASDTAAADAATLLSAPLPSAPVDAARTETTPLTRTEREEIVRQAAEGIGAMRLPAKAGVTEQMTLHLHPKDWGRLQVSIRVSSAPSSGALSASGALPSQTVTAHIVAGTPQVKAALENQSGDLRAALREAGLTLDRLTVTVQAAGASGQSGEMPGHHQPNDSPANGGSGFGQSLAGQSASAGNSNVSAGSNSAAAPSNTGGSSFTGGAGNSQSGQQGGQPAYAAAYAAPEADRDETPEGDASRRSVLGQVDMRA